MKTKRLMVAVVAAALLAKGFAKHTRAGKMETIYFPNTRSTVLWVEFFDLFQVITVHGDSVTSVVFNVIWRR